MKPLLGIDITQNKKNDRFDGDAFIVARPSAGLADTLDKTSDAVIEKARKSKLPMGFLAVRWICGLFALIVAMATVRSLADGVGLAQAYRNAGWVFWVGGGCLIVWLILTIVGHRRRKAVLGSDETERIVSELDRTSEEIFAELDVPSYAPVVDILSFTYKIKDGRPKVARRGTELTPYNNFEYKIFGDHDYLYLASLEEKYAFRRSSLRAIHTVKKKITLPNWNKEKRHDDEIYKPFKLVEDNMGMIYVNPYHILELEENGELWGIYFPSYELPGFEALTGLRAE